MTNKDIVPLGKHAPKGHMHTNTDKRKKHRNLARKQQICLPEVTYDTGAARMTLNRSVRFVTLSSIAARCQYLPGKHSPAVIFL
jgi:hypothetical protein